MSTERLANCLRCRPDGSTTTFVSTPDEQRPPTWPGRCLACGLPLRWCEGSPPAAQGELPLETARPPP